MFQLNNQEKRQLLVSLIPVILSVLVSFLISNTTNNYQAYVWGQTPISKVVGVVNNSFSAAYPVIHVFFLVVTSRMMLFILSVNIERIKVLTSFAYSYIIMFLSLSFFLYNLLAFQSDFLSIKTGVELSSIKLAFGLKLSDFGTISLIAYYAMIALASLILWIKNRRENLFFIAVSLSIPSLLVVLIQNVLRLF